MVDDRWKDHLPWLLRGDKLAQGELYLHYFEYVFGTLLQFARWYNSEAGAPVPDPELKDLADEVTGEAFARAFVEIDSYDPERSALPTWIIWKGRSLMSKPLNELIKIGIADKTAVHLDEPDDITSAAADMERESAWVGADPESATIERESAEEILAILRDMPADQARALVAICVRWAPGRGPIGQAAQEFGRSSSAMDSLLRRAVREFRRRRDNLRTLGQQDDRA